LHLLFVGRIADRIAAPFLVACGQFLVCGLISLLCAGLSEVITLAGIRQALLPIVYAGAVSVAIGFTAQVVGQRYAQPADAAIILSAETVFAALFGFLLMGDRLNAKRCRWLCPDSRLHRRRPGCANDPGCTAGPGKQTITRRLRSGFRHLRKILRINALTEHGGATEHPLLARNRFWLPNATYLCMRISVLLPNRLSTRSTASSAVMFRRSSAGLSSTISSEHSRPVSAIISMHSCASR
jgi:hypothetical protein